MRATVVAGAALLLAATVGALSIGPGLAASQDKLGVQVQGDFIRPDVAPLPADGKFKVVSQTSWPGAKVRVFFLGAQF